MGAPLGSRFGSVRPILMPGFSSLHRPRYRFGLPHGRAQLAALVEAGGMAQRRHLEALRQCMMSGVTTPPWRSRFYLASRKVRNKSIASVACALVRRSKIGMAVP